MYTTHPTMKHSFGLLLLLLLFLSPFVLLVEASFSEEETTNNIPSPRYPSASRALKPEETKRLRGKATELIGETWYAPTALSMLLKTYYHQDQ
jgi:hypothetical protein